MEVLFLSNLRRLQFPKEPSSDQEYLMGSARTSLIPLLLSLGWFAAASAGSPNLVDYDAARWNPIHFPPAIQQAQDAQCLECHREVLERRVLDKTPAGLETGDTLAWYQTVDTYAGEQETFHRRHLASGYATQVMDLKCNTCHQGNDPRDETANSHADGDPNLIQRKHVDPSICLMCHGHFPAQLMGVPGDWREYGHLFQDNCLTCHNAFRTNRHQVNYLKPESIEQLAQQSSDVCFGCHGGRSWFRISFPYPRNPWPGMADDVPEWAKNRPTQSDPRFLTGISHSAERTP
jgi:hypothetical protein